MTMPMQVITSNAGDGEDFTCSVEAPSSEAVASSANDETSGTDNVSSSIGIPEEMVDHPTTPPDVPCIVGRKYLRSHNRNGSRDERIAELFLLGFLARGAEFHEYMVRNFTMCENDQPVYLKGEDLTGIIAAIEDGRLPQFQTRCDMNLLRYARNWVNASDLHWRGIYYQRGWWNQ